MKANTTNPYVGLRPFDTEESLLFFGRKEQTLELLQRLHLHNFVAVVGSSGSGKSSLLRAGLIPLLKAGYLVDGSDHWHISIMKPGQNPLYNLMEAILRQLDSEMTSDKIGQAVEQLKEEGSEAIINLIKTEFKGKQANFFLLVDQFEELFRFSREKTNISKRDDAIDFVNIILNLANQKDSPFYVVITMRSDFIGDCSQFHGLPEALNKSLYLVPKMNRQQLKMVIEAPAKLFGGKINPTLTSMLVNDIGKVQDELPLLQHALMRTWDYEMTVNKSGELDKQDYQDIGGLTKALSNHADEALKGMSKAEIKTTKNLFKALTGRDDNGRKIRKPALLSSLVSITGSNEKELLDIIDKFIGQNRSFLVINPVGQTDDKVVDISHESLIRQWNTLSGWVDEETDAASYYLKLSNDLRLYKDDKKDLLAGTELEIASTWFKDFNPSPLWASRYNNDFEACEKYLRESETAYKKDQLKEQRRLRNKKYLKRFGVTLLVILGPILTYYIGKYYFINVFTNYEKLALNNTKKGDSVEGYLLFLQEYPDSTSVYYKEAVDSIISKENKIDEANWANANKEESIEAYTKYLEQVYHFGEKKYDSIASMELDKFLSESTEEIKEDNLEWAEALGQNTVTSYINYIMSNDDKGEEIKDAYGKVIGSRHSKEAYQKLDSVQKSGWLYSGRLSNNNSVLKHDPVFKIVWRDSRTAGLNGEVPKVGDFVEALRIRSTYKRFNGREALDKNGFGPIKPNEKARVKSVKIVGSALFLEVLY